MLVQQENLSFKPSDNETPEVVFQRIWVKELLLRVRDALMREYEAAGKIGEYDLFCRRIIAPALEGGKVPPLRIMAEQIGLTEKQASNRGYTWLSAVTFWTVSGRQVPRR